jgi:hypothetical protein
MRRRRIVNNYDKAFDDATADAVLYGHGFIRLSYNDGFEAHHIKHSEFDSIKELFDWIKNNRVEIDK